MVGFSLTTQGSGTKYVHTCNQGYGRWTCRMTRHPFLFSPSIWASECFSILSLYLPLSFIHFFPPHPTLALFVPSPLLSSATAVKKEMVRTLKARGLSAFTRRSKKFSTTMNFRTTPIFSAFVSHSSEVMKK